MPFVAVNTRRLYQEVADQVAQLIRRGEYKAGDALPSERELGKALQVSRPVVREAMVALEVAGMVEVRGGSGVYVTTRAMPLQVPDVGEGPYEVFVVRRALEGEMAAAAAVSADASALAELELALEMVRQDEQVSPPTNAGDRRFHAALAAATGNSAYVELNQFVWDKLIGGGELWPRLISRRNFRASRVAEHEAIFVAIRDRNPEAARRAAQEHLDGAIRDFLEVAGIGETDAAMDDDADRAGGKS